jgi:hypothetical protein
VQNSSSLVGAKSLLRTRGPVGLGTATANAVRAVRPQDSSGCYQRLVCSSKNSKTSFSHWDTFVYKKLCPSLAD